MKTPGVARSRNPRTLRAKSPARAGHRPSSHAASAGGTLGRIRPQTKKAAQQSGFFLIISWSWTGSNRRPLECDSSGTYVISIRYGNILFPQASETATITSLFGGTAKLSKPRIILVLFVADATLTARCRQQYSSNRTQRGKAESGGFAMRLGHRRIFDPDIVRRILDHLGLPVTPPQCKPARGPPENIPLFEN
jgi:hypothetical protein